MLLEDGGVEMLTKKSRLILRPLEELQIQLKGSVAINKVDIDATIDKQFKPGLFLQIKQFLTGNHSEFKSIQEQAESCGIYSQIAKGNKQNIIFFPSKSLFRFYSN